jgi:hypothetical protein
MSAPGNTHPFPSKILPIQKTPVRSEEALILMRPLQMPQWESLAGPDTCQTLPLPNLSLRGSNKPPGMASKPVSSSLEVTIMVIRTQMGDFSSISHYDDPLVMPTQETVLLRWPCHSPGKSRGCILTYHCVLFIKPGGNRNFLGMCVAGWLHQIQVHSATTQLLVLQGVEAAALALDLPFMPHLPQRALLSLRQAGPPASEAQALCSFSCCSPTTDQGSVHIFYPISL